MSVIFPRVGMLSVVILSAIMLNVIYGKSCNKVHCPRCLYLSAIMLSVIAPFGSLPLTIICEYLSK
jgi:hypothetical protein